MYLKKLFGLLYPTWTNVCEKIFQMIFLAVLSENTVQCPKRNFYVFYRSTLFQSQVFNFLFN